MPRQNRVTPCGEIVAYPERGLFMGNRGVLVDQHGNLTSRRWSTHAWIICALEFKGRRLPLAEPGHNTQLFFLDEATALAAGHRPCGECRRADFSQFKSLWLEANPSLIAGPNPSIQQIDRIIHAERVHPRTRIKITYRNNIDALANGVFIALDDARDACMVWDDALWRWSPRGYSARISRPRGASVTVLTPRSIARTLAAGYVPVVHGVVPCFQTLSIPLSACGEGESVLFSV